MNDLFESKEKTTYKIARIDKILYVEQCCPPMAFTALWKSVNYAWPKRAISKESQ